MHNKFLIRIMLILFVLDAPLFMLFADGGPAEKEEGTVSIAFKAVKSSYKLGEPVNIAVAVANFTDKPVYLPVRENEIFFSDFDVKDINGVRITGRIVGDPNTMPPQHYYMNRDGKKILMSPVFEIPSKGLFLSIIPDVLKGYYQKLKSGQYYIEPFSAGVMQEAPEVTFRPDFPEWLWVETFDITMLIKHDPIEINIE